MNGGAVHVVGGNSIPILKTTLLKMYWLCYDTEGKVSPCQLANHMQVQYKHRLCTAEWTKYSGVIKEVSSALYWTISQQIVCLWQMRDVFFLNEEVTAPFVSLFYSINALSTKFQQYCISVKNKKILQDPGSGRK